MDLVVGFEHAQYLLSVEQAHLVLGVDEHEAAGGPVPAELADGAPGLGVVDEGADPQAVAIAHLAGELEVLELDVIDHYNGTQRSVRTLSGGESFKASLALALGLSDEVQMSTGIRLDTMFVDEGFGSLDSEALSKAYSTLAGLTEGNRLVGIISHVTELKERIDKQIVVTKEKGGGSKAVIASR